MSRILLCAGLLLPFSAPDSKELERVKPAEVKLNAAKLEAIPKAMQALVDEHKIPGSVSIVARHGKIARVDVVGLRDLESKTPMTEDTIFAIASMSKPITCVALMTLVEEGKVSIDDPLSKFLPQFKDMKVLGDPKDDKDGTLAIVPTARPVTIAHLLSHASGFTYGGFMSTDARLSKAYRDAGVDGVRPKTIAEQVEKLAKVPLAHQPGEGWTYGFSHDILGRVIEVVSNQSFDKFLNDRIFTPLDMRDTSFYVPMDKRSRVAVIYRVGENGKPEAIPKNYGSETFFSGARACSPRRAITRDSP